MLHTYYWPRWHHNQLWLAKKIQSWDTIGQDIQQAEQWAKNWGILCSNSFIGEYCSLWWIDQTSHALISVQVFGFIWESENGWPHKCSGCNVPPRVMDLLRIFLVASSRGEEAVLTLETSKKAISTKYRSVESPAEVPAAPNNTTLPKKKKKNPARAKRSRLRLEEYIKRCRLSPALHLEVPPTSWSSSWTRRMRGMSEGADLTRPFLK